MFEEDDDDEPPDIFRKLFNIFCSDKCCRLQLKIKKIKD